MADPRLQRDLWGPTFVTVSTEGVVPASRFDWWRALFHPVQIERNHDAGGVFNGRYSSCQGRDGLVLNAIDCGATRTVMAGDDSHLLISGFSRGEIQTTIGRDRQLRGSADGRLYLLDPARGATMSSQGHANIYLAVPRAMAAALMGPRLPDLAVLDDGPLTRLLWSQMQAVAALGPSMRVSEATAAMDTLSGLARSALIHGLRDEEGRGAEDRYRAALAFIDAFHHRPGLTAEKIARAVGGSRAQLYRTFARHGATVQGVIREVRLTRALSLLARPGPDVSEIALACGYADAASLSKAFRTRFGCSPGEARQG